MSSGTVAVWAMKDNDYEPTEFAGTTAGLQAAIDYLAGGKGKVFVGPGTLETTTAIWIHSYCHLQGSGRGVTIIKRASGSITDSDAANSGAVLATSAFGFNGTLSSSSAIQFDITVSDMTIDGNSQAFGSLASGTPHQAGLLAHSVDGLTVHGVTVQNTLRSGYMLAECKNVMLSDVEADTVGQFSVVTTRNAFDFYNFNAATVGHGAYFTCNNFRVSNVGDEAFSLTNVSNVAISNGVIDTCDMAFELQGSANTASDGNITISNVTATNMTAEALIIHGNANGHDYNDVAMFNCTFDGTAATHNARMLAFEPSTANSVTGCRVQNCTFRNINTLDTTARSWIDMSSNTGSNFRDISIIGCSFYGLSTSTRTADSGLNLLATNCSDILIKDCLFKNVPGRGIRIHDPASSTTRNIRIESVTVDTSTAGAFQLAGETAATTIQDIFFLDCIAKDCNTGSGDSAFEIVSSAALTAFNRIFLRGCRAYATGSTPLYGLRLNETSGTIDNVIVENCDFTGVVTAAFRPVTGTPTNIHFTPNPGRGTEITAAATIAIPTDGNIFHVTGNTNITNGITVNAWDNGRTVTLIFEGTPTVSDTGTSKLAGNFVAAGTTNDFDTLTLVCDGTNWTEVARSTN